jgi:hypothetical protein
MRLVGQLFLAATAIAAANGCDRHTQLSPEALAAEADANAKLCAQTVMQMISLAFGTPPVTAVAAAKAPPER